MLFFKNHFRRVRIYDLLDLDQSRETSTSITIEEESRVEHCSWCHDGRMLGITGASGSVYIYLTRLNLLASASLMNGNIAVLSSLQEV